MLSTTQLIDNEHSPCLVRTSFRFLMIDCDCRSVCVGSGTGVAAPTGPVFYRARRRKVPLPATERLPTSFEAAARSCGGSSAMAFVQLHFSNDRVKDI